MQAVILAAGKSTRTYPLTITTPKALLPILGKTLIERTLDQLIGLVEEVIIIVGFCKQDIIDSLGNSYKDMKIHYAVQGDINGTGGAILAAKSLLKGKFLVLNGDDLYSRKDIERCLKHDYCIMGMEIDNPSDWGILTLKEGKVISLIEKPKEADSNIANIGLYVFDTKIFEHELKVTERGEYEITDYVKYLIETSKISCELVSDFWLPVGYPWKYLEASIFFLRRMKESIIKGKVEQGVTINGIVYIGKGTVVKSGSYIEGPVYIGENCEVGPQAYLRPDSILLDKTRIRCEVIDSVLMEGTTAKHYSYIGHSVIGKNVNIGAGTVTADYRHDGKDNWTIVNDQKVCSGRRKLGAFIGDEVKTGINTAIYPGRKIWPGKTTLPGEVVTKDIR